MNAWSLLYDILNGTFDEEYPIVGKKETEHSDYYYDYTRNDPNAKNPFTDPKDRERAKNLLEDCNGLDYEVDLMTDQYAHHYSNANSPYNDGWTQQYHQEQLEKMSRTDNNFKYHEDEILKDIQEYVSRTYQGHYTGTKHEFRKVQTIDLMAARDIATGFCQANILKYGSRYGSKDGKNKTDLLKVIHYAMLLLHFDGHYGEPSMPSGNFDQMP